MGFVSAGVIFYTYSLAFNPAKAKLALEEKGIKVGHPSLIPHRFKIVVSCITFSLLPMLF